MDRQKQQSAGGQKSCSSSWSSSECPFPEELGKHLNELNSPSIGHNTAQTCPESSREEFRGSALEPLRCERASLASSASFLLQPTTMASSEICTDCLPEQPTQQPAAAPVASTSILDPSTFSPPNVQQGELPRVEIEFCDRCELSHARCALLQLVRRSKLTPLPREGRWLHRAVWTQTELFLTFPPTSTTSPEGVTTESGIKAITLLPRSAPETGGRFRVWLYRSRTIEEEYEQNCPDSWGSAELVWDRKVSSRRWEERS